ncbi:xanthine dehydrogenase accessory protein XdhC [Rubripirellula amarantea]|uniref:XdhC and CoxI family protein n=1 Tax=Rubripirellula amarantea TaxID=2527999 RepID=A0A5C5WTI5_9BACT|nr:xanthine dehydrogenase accessory protein XdhC [Rubripirellula amarantea]MDA8744440.1 xanthine dehydrogenase accessory protein XdhC [Rubripirellula amarantea]TWT53333.1 XdhC and CoxI family protein [Rubripirellula amarantea]
MTKNVSHIESLASLAAGGLPFVAVTMVEAIGSTPQDAGSKMLVDANGLVHGTVGGGKVEFHAIEFAKEMLADPSRCRALVDWNLQRDIGMTCGGLVKLYFEVYNRDHWHVVVFGAGHVAQALLKVLGTLDCHVTCVDTRIEWMKRIDDHPRLTKKCVDDLTTVAATLTSNDYVICMTMGHSTDRPVLATLFQNAISPAYLGVIGSKSKRGVLERELREEGIDAETAASFLCPIGLPIGSNQPAEIAISISAQLLQHRDRIKNV